MLKDLLEMYYLNDWDMPIPDEVREHYELHCS